MQTQKRARTHIHTGLGLCSFILCNSLASQTLAQPFRLAFQQELGVTLGNVPLDLIRTEHSENNPSSEKTWSFLSGSVWGGMKSHHKTRRRVQRDQDTWQRHGSHMGMCVWNHVTGDGDKMLATCLCPLILASGNSHPPWHWLLMALATFQGSSLSPTPPPTLPPSAHKQRLWMQTFSLGSNLQTRMFFHLKEKNKQGKQSHIT